MFSNQCISAVVRFEHLFPYFRLHFFVLEAPDWSCPKEKNAYFLRKHIAELLPN
jgi:hypothetical protein